jgi:lysozyme
VRRRTVVVVTGVALLTVGLVMAAWWLCWLPNVRPSLRSGEVYGIDVSSHQGRIDWRRVAADDIAFAYIKASEGGDFTDARFRENWAAAHAAGVDRGAYHFFTLCRPGEQQAEHFLRTAPVAPAALPPAVDLELIGNCDDRPDPAHVYAELDAFLDRLEMEWGRPTLLYVGDDWESRYPVLARSDRPRWLKSFVGRPGPGWSVWQLHGFAHVSGVRGGVDLNVARWEELRSVAKRGS